MGFSRRDLIAGAAGWPLIVSSPIRGAAAPSESPRIGFIGMRNRGMQNLKPLLQYAVAVCDVDARVGAQARAAVEATGRPCEAYEDYRLLLDRSDIDAVVISTPDHWHALQTIHACEAGKDVYAEKPLTLVIDEGRTMVEAARRHRRVVQTGSQQRSDEKFRIACEMIRSGHLGRLRSVKVGIPGNNFDPAPVPDAEPPDHLNYNYWLGPAPWRPYNENRVHYNFRFFWDYSGGQMTNWGAHHLDIVQWALGMDESGPVEVSGSCGYKPGMYYEVPDTYDLSYSYPGDLKVLCGTAHRGGITFEGERGSIFVNRGRLEASPSELLTETVSGRIELEQSPDHYQNWVSCIKSRRRPICDIEIGHRSATVCHLGNIAARTGRPVRWDPVKEKIMGDSLQAAMTAYPYRTF